MSVDLLLYSPSREVPTRQQLRTMLEGKGWHVLFVSDWWKFARRTLQLFADQSRRGCAWAQAFYEQQRAKGHTHHAALRALAHKWLKIILAIRRTGTPYNEAVFVHSQQRRLSQDL